MPFVFCFFVSLGVSFGNNLEGGNPGNGYGMLRGDMAVSRRACVLEMGVWRAHAVGAVCVPRVEIINRRWWSMVWYGLLRLFVSVVEIPDGD